jgi:ABC-type glycerol-3-phosphate transport system permease component
MARKKVHDKKWSAFYVIALVILLVYTLSLFVPVLWAIVTSFKEVITDWNLGNTIGAPKVWYWQNYVYVFSKYTLPITINGGQPARVDVIGMFSNSFLYAIGCAFCKTAIPLVMSFLCARFPCKLSKIIHTIVIVTMILPVVGSLPSEIKMAHALGLYDSIFGLWFMKSNFLGEKLGFTDKELQDIKKSNAQPTPVSDLEPTTMGSESNLSSDIDFNF